MRQQLNKSCNYSFTTLIFPPRLSYRTGQDTANCDTCRNSACIIYRWVVGHLQRQKDPHVTCPFLSLRASGGVRQGQDQQRGSNNGGKANVKYCSLVPSGHGMFTQHHFSQNPYIFSQLSNYGPSGHFIHWLVPSRCAVSRTKGCATEIQRGHMQENWVNMGPWKVKLINVKHHKILLVGPVAMPTQKLRSASSKLIL